MNLLVSTAASAQLPSSPIVVVIVALLLMGISLPIARRLSRGDNDPRLVSLAMIALLLHFLGSGIQIFVDDHVYHGVSDFQGYVHQGAALSGNFRSLHFTLAGAGVRDVVGSGSVSIVAGIVFAFTGVNELASFFVFGWFAWLGTTLFYRAFCHTFPEGDHRRYALMLFLFPSLLYWASDVSKEALVMMALGVATLGTARVLVRKRYGYLLVAVGTGMGVVTRPNEFALLLGGFTIAVFFRRRDNRRELRAVRKLGTLVFLALILLLTGVLLLKFLHTSSGGITSSLNKAHTNNAGSGAGFGSSNVPYSSDPLLYPRDVYTVLFDPLPITAGSLTQLIAAGENSVILVLILTSLRRLRLAFRAGRERPYVLMCIVYTLGFLYTFAALGNLGLITRERTLLFPYLLVLLAIPVVPKGEPPKFPWEKPRVKRRDRRLAAARGGFVPPR
jgi:4-amino-4-deoxy-L-arabinose transferase-like glycosyltransferase